MKAEEQRDDREERRRPDDPVLFSLWGALQTCESNRHCGGAVLQPQEAADDLLERLVAMALAVRDGGFTVSSVLVPSDLRIMSFLHGVADRAAAREDLRGHVLRGAPSG